MSLVGAFNAVAIIGQPKQHTPRWRVSPSWAVPWFNRGLTAKFAHRCDSLRFNLQATKLDPSFKPAWWSYRHRRDCHWRLDGRRLRHGSTYGVAVPPGDGPLDMRLGGIPIRIDPSGTAEVVWCERLDPARARIVNIPFPDSGRACGDILLTDGEAQGYREAAGRQVPVFNELEVLSASTLSTFSANVQCPRAVHR